MLQPFIQVNKVEMMTMTDEDRGHGRAAKQQRQAVTSRAPIKRMTVEAMQGAVRALNVRLI